MIDYDAEAATYDETRGGQSRADHAATAIAELAGSGPGIAVDVAGGTGSVAAALARYGWRPAVLDRSHGMLQVAASRLPGQQVRGDATRLPFAAGSVDLVTTIWLLHLVPDLADAVIGEAARVCRPGGHWVTSVDKARSHGRAARSDADRLGRVADVARELGMHAVGTATFTGDTVWTGTVGSTQTFTLAAFRRRS